jgi:HJR/Mrr/RecB family endonuclease
MNRSIKVILYIVILYLYYRFIFYTRDSEEGVKVIVFSAILWMGMKAFKDKEKKETMQKASLQALDQMDQKHFTAYMIRLYKQLGYAIELVGRGKILEGAFIVKKDKKNSLITCKKLSLEEQLEEEEVEKFIQKIVFYRCQKGIFATNGYVEQNLLETVKEKEIENNIDIEIIPRERLKHILESLK